MYSKNGMMMYVGKYRVVCEFCQNNLKPCEEDNYIYCSGGQIYRYNDDVLVYSGLTPVKTDAIEKMLYKYALPSNAFMGSGIKFYEKDLDAVALIVKARVKGANVKPKSKQNLKLCSWYKAE